MRVVDLTGPLTRGMWDYGAPLPPVDIAPIATLEQQGWSGHRLNLNTLSGTYIETAAHVFTGRETIADVHPERFVLKAWVAHLPTKRPLEQITHEDLERASRNATTMSGQALLVSTGWDRNWNSEGFVEECPHFTEEAMEWVISQGVSLLGLDIPCVQDPRSDDGTLVRRFFEQDRLLLAPIINLTRVSTGPFTLVSLPLRIPNVCGTPCRAILIENM